MKSFSCDCGSKVFFDNDCCLSCGRQLGFDASRLSMVTLENIGGALADAQERCYRRCGNYRDYGNCNWLLPANDDSALCASCRLNDVVPALDRPDNLKLWTRMEQAKRRLLYSLFKLRLQISGRGGQSGLRFCFLEDRQRNPAVFENFVATAHLDGTITINIAEADDAVRHAVREQMHERYRTVLGHLRHESGHFFFPRLADTPERLEECRELFGDERVDYESTLRSYYQNGPVADWPEHFVSAYASAHPAEDFAETFAHLLHIEDALETARDAGMELGTEGWEGDWLSDWIGLAITLNELLRGLGADDPYPFVLTEPVMLKLQFMNRLVRRPGAQADG